MALFDRAWWQKTNWDALDDQGKRVALGDTETNRMLREAARARMDGGQAQLQGQFAPDAGHIAEQVQRAADLSASRPGAPQLTAGPAAERGQEYLTARARVLASQAAGADQAKAAGDLVESEDWNLRQDALRQAYRARALNKVLEEREAKKKLLTGLAKTGVQLGATALGGPAAGSAAGGLWDVGEGALSAS